MRTFDVRSCAWWCLSVAGAVLTGLAAGGQPVATRLLVLLVALVAAMAVVARPSMGPVAASLTVGLSTLSPSLWLQLGGLALAAVSILAGWGKAEQEQRRVGGLFLALAAWGVFAGSAIADGNPQQAALTLQFLFSAVLAAAVAVAAPRLRWLLVALAWPPISAVIYLARHTDVVESRGDALHLGENANSLGALAALVVVLAAAAVWSHRILFVPAMALGAVASIAVLNSGSRGAVVVAVVGTVVSLASGVWRRSIGKAFWVTLLLGLLGWQFGQIILASALRRVGRSVGVGEGFDERGRILEFALQVGYDHPLAGVGFGTLEGLSVASPEVRLQLSAHNAFAGVFAALGVPGVVMFVTLFFLALRRSSARSPGILFPLALVAVAASASIEWHVTRLLGPILFVGLAAAATYRLPRAQDGIEEADLPERVGR